jgi:hypothetical protein
VAAPAEDTEARKSARRSPARQAGVTGRHDRKDLAVSRFLDRYVRTAGSPDLAGIRAALWNDKGQPAGTVYQDAVSSTVLEQDKLYVEMADRISARRGVTNTFFLTLNTAAVSAIGILWSSHLRESRWILAFLFAGLLAQCLAWFWLLRSYRQLNSAKYAVVGVLEERLPASPYWPAEWAALGEGNDPARYWPLTHLEQWIPSLFAAIYLFGFILGMAIR